MAILKYIGRRLLMLIPVLIGISLAAFLLGRIAPGDPVDDALFRIGIEFPTEADRAAMRAELGLDRPLPEQYLRWLGDALRGDLGESYTDGRDIAQELARRLPITLKVSMAAGMPVFKSTIVRGILVATVSVKETPTIGYLLQSSSPFVAISRTPEPLKFCVLFICTFCCLIDCVFMALK